jgi:hypothetical protein
MKFITEYPNWYEFTKRLPRVTPRYRRNTNYFTQHDAQILQALYALAEVQNMPDKLQAQVLQAQQAQQLGNYQNPILGFLWPFGCPWQ